VNNLSTSLRSLSAALCVAVAIAGTMIVSAPSAAFAAGSCPITVSESGSTTVYPALIEAQAGFQAATGCTINIVGNGSGAGLTALLAGSVNIAASSRPLNAGAEQSGLYAWQIGGDAMVLAVRNSSAMSSITQITQNQVQGIYNGSITNWNQINPSATSMTIVPRSRITVSGSYSDMLRLFNVTAAQEAAVVTASGQPRLTTSQDEADAACNNDGQIVYTSLANLLTYGPAGSGCLKALSLSAGSSSTYVAPSVTSVQNGTYPAPRQLFLAMQKWSVVGGAATTDNSANVKAQALVNYMLSAAGQAAVAQVGFVTASVPSAQPIPDYDVTLVGAIGLGAIGNITGRWGQTSACNGWIRADAAHVGAVGLAAIGKVTAHWGQTGFVAP
jgi:phosphate transport system substrate-binding protein